MFICFIRVGRNESFFDHMFANALSKIENIWDFFAMRDIWIFALCNICKCALRKFKLFESRKEETSKFHPLLSPNRIERQNSDLGRGLAEAQQPKTFQIATFYAQKLSRRSARNRSSQQTLNIARIANAVQVGHYLIVSHYSSMSWFRYRNLSVIVTSVIKSQIH